MMREESSPRRALSRGREWLLRSLLVIASLVVGTVLAEIVTRIVRPISDGRDNVTLDGVRISGWFEPGSVYRQVSNEYDALTTITSRGHRVPGTDGNPEVVFLGDSFTYGWGLADDETFASIYCARRVECANLGVPGTGTAKQLDRLERFLHEYRWQPAEVKLFFFGMSGSWSAGNDFVDNYNERGVATPPPPTPLLDQRDAAPPPPRHRSLPERIIATQSLVLGHSNLARLAKYYWGPLLKSLVIADPGEQRFAEALEYTRRMLARLDELSVQAGFKYTIYLIVPVQDVIRGSHVETLAALNSVAPKAAVPTAQLFVDDPQSYYYAYDGHLNMRGARKIGEYLLSTLTSTAERSQ